jgi:hypothetical protein
VVLVPGVLEGEGTGAGDVKGVEVDEVDCADAQHGAVGSQESLARVLVGSDVPLDGLQAQYATTSCAGG